MLVHLILTTLLEVLSVGNQGSGILSDLPKSMRLVLFVRLRRAQVPLNTSSYLQKLFFSSKDLLRYHAGWGPKVKLLSALPSGPSTPSQHHVVSKSPALPVSLH